MQLTLVDGSEKDEYLLGFDIDNLTEDDIDTILIYPGGVFPELLEEYGELKLFEENISKQELLAFLKYFVRDYKSKLDWFGKEIYNLRKKVI
ncbi:hypothetical protein [Metaclostridioides mangenotii]|uniref:hypothetical protein n=1 Tax=Metaclostridioides mangenotii TaxID=1540 RepID=UPI00048877A2|nr:hypothetical protein [Clostridioides mangenotii]